VKIEIEDENAKYPLNWALLADEKLKPLAETGFATFASGWVTRQRRSPIYERISARSASCGCISLSSSR